MLQSDFWNHRELFVYRRAKVSFIEMVRLDIQKDITIFYVTLPISLIVISSVKSFMDSYWKSLSSKSSRLIVQIFFLIVDADEVVDYVWWDSQSHPC